MSPEQMMLNDLKCLAFGAIRALSVNSNKPTAEMIMQHSIVQACIELRAVESVLESHEGEVGTLVYIVQAIRQRLEFAADASETLATIIAQSGAAEANPGPIGVHVVPGGAP